MITKITHPKDAPLFQLIAKLGNLTQKITELQLAQAATGALGQLKTTAIMSGQKDALVGLENKLKELVEKHIAPKAES